MNKLNLVTLLVFCFLTTLVHAQCPTGTCEGYTTELSTAVIPLCGSMNLDSRDGDLDNNSTCEDSNGDNCYKFVFNQHDPLITGVTMDIGKGNGCNGEVNTFFTNIEGNCTDHGSSGSQNTFTFDFGPSGVIDLWLCDNSSGQVSICLLCAESLSGLPVELSEFTGKYQNGKIFLQWTTASEEDNKHFEIQKSINGFDYRTIGIEEGNGTSDLPIDYLHVDRKPSASAYYRLKQIDFNDQFEYSDVIFVNRGNTGTLTAIPSKVNQELLLRAETLGAQNSILTITNASGQVVLQKRYQNLLETEYITLDVSNFQPGIFFAALFNPNETVVTKFFVTND